MAPVSRRPRARSEGVRRLGFLIGLALAGCGGAHRDYPRWTVAAAATSQSECVLAQAWIRVSGKTGVGMTVQLRSLGDCTVRVARAELVIAGQRVAAELPAALTLPGRSQAYLWLPFAFDNNQAWNDGARRGQFELVLEANGRAGAPWVIPATHGFVSGRWKPEPTPGRY